MARSGKLFIKYRDPVAASFSSKDIVFNVQSGTIFYKRNRKLHALRGTPDGFDLVVFPGQSDSSQYQILINDQGTMTGTDQLQFKPASATCGCANYFTIGRETLTTYSGSVRIGEFLSSSCNILQATNMWDPALKVYGDLEVVTSPSTSMAGQINADGHIITAQNFYGDNLYVYDTMYHRDNTSTNIAFTTDQISLTAGSTSQINMITSSAGDEINFYTDSTKRVEIDNSGDVFAYQNVNVTKDISVTNITASGHITASDVWIADDLYINGVEDYPIPSNTISVLTIRDGKVYSTSSNSFTGTGGTGGTDVVVTDEGNTIGVTAAQSFDFVGGGVKAEAVGQNVTITVTTSSLWYDGYPDFISSSDNVVIDGTVGIGVKHPKSTSSLLYVSGGDIAEVILESANKSSVQYHTKNNQQHFKFGLLETGSTNYYDNLQSYSHSFALHDETYSNIPFQIQRGVANNSVIIHSSSFNLGGASVGSVGIGTTSPKARLHVLTSQASIDRLPVYNTNGIVIGPPSESNSTIQHQKSGLYLINGPGGKFDDGLPDRFTPTIRGINNDYQDSVRNSGLVIEGYTSRSYASHRAEAMVFIVKDLAKQGYIALTSSVSEGTPTGSYMGEGTEWVDYNSDNNAFAFYNDQSSILAINPIGKLGIGPNYFQHNQRPDAYIHLRTVSSSNADILLEASSYDIHSTANSNWEVTPSITLKHTANSNLLDIWSGSKAQIKLFVDENPNKYRYRNQAKDALFIEAIGTQHSRTAPTEHNGLYPYPYGLKRTPDIQFVVGGIISGSNTETTRFYSGSAVMTISSSQQVGINRLDIARYGEVSLHATGTIESTNFRTTDPVSVLQVSSSLLVVSASSNQIEGVGTHFTSMSVGDAVRVQGYGDMFQLNGTFKVTNGSDLLTGSSYPNIVQLGNELRGAPVVNLIRITDGTTNTFHTVTHLHSNTSGTIDPVWSGATGTSATAYYQNINYSQISTISEIDSDTSMSIEDNYLGSTSTLSRLYRDPDQLFEVKTGDYKPRFSVDRSGSISASGDLSIVGHPSVSASLSGITVDTFKHTGKREGDSEITGSLILSGSGTPSLNVLGEITSSGNISSSAEFIGASAYITNITASNNISASGLLYASSSIGNYTNVVVHDTASGLFYTTASAAVGNIRDTFKYTGQRDGNSAITGSLHLVGTSGLPWSLISDGNISSSGYVLAPYFDAKQSNTGYRIDGTSYLYINSGELQVGEATTNIDILGDDVSLISTGDIILDSTTDIILDAAGDDILFRDNGTINATLNTNTGDFRTIGHLSASGFLYASASEGNYSDIVVHDPTDGRFYTTASSALTVDTFKSSGTRSGDGFIDGHITASGNISASGTGSFKRIGIGTSSPEEHLHIVSPVTTREILLNGDKGTVSSKGSSGGWAMFHKFIGNNDTDHGGFYGHGNGDDFYRYGISPAFDSEDGLFVLSGSNKYNVGIGVLNPTERLHISGALGFDTKILVQTNQGGEAILQLQNNHSSSFYLQTYEEGVRIRDASNGNSTYPFIVQGSNVNDETLVLSETNRVGISTDTPGEKLEVIGNISASGFIYSSASYTEVVDKVLVWNDAAGGRHDWASPSYLTQAITFKQTGQRSGSAAVTGSFTVKDDYLTANSITSSNDISASGFLFASASMENRSPNVAIYDSESGEFHYTSSLGFLGKLENLTAGSNISFNVGTTYNGSQAITISATGGGTGGAGGLVDTGSCGYLAYYTICPTGSTVDDSTIYFDSSNDRLGIGTDSPSKKLEIAGSISASGDLYLGNTGTNSYIYFGAAATDDTARIYTDNTTSQTNLHIRTTDNNNDNIIIHTDGYNVSNSGSILLMSEDIDIYGRSTIGQYVKFDGNQSRVGIKDTSPKSTLHVAGDLTVDSIITASSNVHVSGHISASTNVTVQKHLTVGKSNPYDTLVTASIYGSGRNLLVLQTDNNLFDRGISFRNSGGAYSNAIYVRDKQDDQGASTGGNDGDLVFAGGNGTSDVTSLTDQMILTGNDPSAHTGFLGIGNMHPSERLTVQGNISASGKIYAAGLGTGTGTHGLFYNTGTGEITFDTAAAGSADGMGAGFVLEDGDGTEVTITENKEVKFIDGNGLNINWTDTSPGSDADPYDLTFDVDNASTTQKGIVELATSAETSTGTSTTLAVTPAGLAYLDYLDEVEFDLGGNYIGDATVDDGSGPKASFNFVGKSGIELSGSDDSKTIGFKFKPGGDTDGIVVSDGTYHNSPSQYFTYDQETLKVSTTSGTQNLNLVNRSYPQRSIFMRVDRTDNNTYSGGVGNDTGNQLIIQGRWTTTVTQSLAIQFGMSDYSNQVRFEHKWNGTATRLANFAFNGGLHLEQINADAGQHPANSRIYTNDQYLHLDPDSPGGGQAGGAAANMGTKIYGDLYVVAGDDTVGKIEAVDDIIAFSTSDKRLKDNVKPISNPLKKLLKIGGYEFDWNENQNTYKGHDVGVIAQEVEKIFPEIVRESEKTGYKSIKYEKLIPLLIESIKEQQKQIDELKEKLNG